MIATPDQAGGPGCSQIQWTRVLYGCRRAHYVAFLLTLRLYQVPSGNLHQPVCVRRDGKPAGVGIHPSPVDVPAVFVRLRAVEAASFQPHPLVAHGHGSDIVCDMRGILPMMAERRLREFEGG